MNSTPPHATPSEPTETDPPPESAGLSGRSWAVVAVIVLAVAAFVAYSLIGATGSDETLEMESAIRAVLDESYERSSLPTWCNPVCSESDDEWHSSEDAETVATNLVAALTAAGFEAEFAQGGPDAFLVTVSDGNGLDLGVTGPEWARASTNAAGTAIWFTSVAIFDDTRAEALS